MYRTEVVSLYNNIINEVQMLSLHICALICLTHCIVFILPNEQPCIVVIIIVLVLLKES